MTISPRKRTMVGRLKSPSKGRKRNSSDEWRPASNFSFSESSIGSRRFISTRTSAAATAARLKSKEGENQKRRQSIMMKRLDLSVSHISTSPASSVRKTRRQSMAPLASMKGRVQKNLEKTKLLMSAAEKSSPVNTLKPKLPLRKSLSTRHAASVPDMTKKDAVRDVSEVKLIKQTSVRSPVRQGYYTRYRSLRSSGSLHSEGNKKRKVELDVIDEFQLQSSSKRRRLGSSPSKKREVSLISSSSKHIQAKDTTLSSKLEKKESIQSLKFEKIDPIPLSKHKEKDETQSPILKRKIDSDKSHEVWRNKDAIKLPKRTKKNYEIQSPRHTAAHVARKSSELAKCVTQLPKLASANDTMQSPQTRTSTVIQSSKTTRASAVIQSSKTTRASAVIQSSKTTTASAVIQSSKTTRASAIIQSPKLNKSSDVIQSSKTARASAIIQSPKLNKSSDVIQSPKLNKSTDVIQSPKLNKSTDKIQPLKLIRSSDKSRSPKLTRTRNVVRSPKLTRTRNVVRSPKPIRTCVVKSPEVKIKVIQSPKLKTTKDASQTPRLKTKNTFKLSEHNKTKDASPSPKPKRTKSAIQSPKITKTNDVQQSSTISGKKYATLSPKFKTRLVASQSPKFKITESASPSPEANRSKTSNFKENISTSSSSRVVQMKQLRKTNSPNPYPQLKLKKPSPKHPRATKSATKSSKKVLVIASSPQSVSNAFRKTPASKKEVQLKSDFDLGSSPVLPSARLQLQLIRQSSPLRTTRKSMNERVKPFTPNPDPLPSYVLKQTLRKKVDYEMETVTQVEVHQLENGKCGNPSQKTGDSTELVAPLVAPSTPSSTPNLPPTPKSSHEHRTSRISRNVESSENIGKASCQRTLCPATPRSSTPIEEDLRLDCLTVDTIVKDSNKKSAAYTCIESEVNTSVESRADTSVESRADTSVESRADTSVESRADTSVESRADTSVESRADTSVESGEDTSMESETDIYVESSTTFISDDYNAVKTMSDNETLSPQSRKSYCMLM